MRTKSYKLTEEEVKEIWNLLKEGKLSQQSIASMFNVNQETISHIATGTRWNSITGLPRRSKMDMSLPPSGVLRGRPRSVKPRTKGYHKRAGKKQYKALEKAAINAIIRGNTFVKVRFKELVNFPKGFPLRKIASVDENGTVEIINAKKLLDWLYNCGYTIWSVKEIESQKLIVGLQLAWVERSLGLEEF